MDKIIDGLYLGDIRAAANLFLLKSHVRCSISIFIRVSLIFFKYFLVSILAFHLI